MSETITRPGTDVLEEMDFEPVCCIRQTYFPQGSCERPAVWVGFSPCCGLAALVCQHHFEVRHTRPFICSRCKGPKGVHNDLINWRRL